MGTGMAVRPYRNGVGSRPKIGPLDFLRLRPFCLTKPFKSDANHAKHGINFPHAQRLWDDPNLLEIPARTVDEPRWLMVGQLEGKHWFAVITYHGDTVRLISARRSRPEEVTLYES